MHAPSARAIMLAGTGSDVGKSLLVAGLCRAFTNRGLRVRPFKPQNMSNNAAVTTNGGEIGRAQALQARASRVAPSVDMNPVLLKPQSDVGAQIIVQGKVFATAKAQAYQDLKPQLVSAVMESFRRLASEADIIVVEGAGSVAEVNLRKGDIANMGFARIADVPVVLIADIDRGGVIAQVVGSQKVIDPADAAMIKGFIVNKFRGDPRLFDEGMATIARLTGWTPAGLVPFFARCRDLPPEDALALESPNVQATKSDPVLRIAVICPPRISNFDDFDPLKLEPLVDLVFVRMGDPIPGDVSLIMLPGSKSTIADLAAIRETGWDIDIKAHVRRGGHVLGICGGYQMMGRYISDPDGIEGTPGTVEGLGLLDIETTLTGQKVLIETSGVHANWNAPFYGYEMHVGRTGGPDCSRPLLHMSDGRKDGAIDRTGRVAGCYVHGLFADDHQRGAWLQRLGGQVTDLDYEAAVDDTLDALAEHLEKHLDCDGLLSVARAPAFK